VSRRGTVPVWRRAIAGVIGVVLAGCGGLLGFQRAEGDGCFFDRDCQVGVCTNGVCTMRLDTGGACAGDLACNPGAPDAGADAPDAQKDTDAIPEVGALLGNQEASTDADGAGCSDRCLLPSTECRQGVCVQAMKWPGFGLTDASFDPVSQAAVCFQISVETCGDLTGVGFDLKGSLGGPARFAVYSDPGGTGLPVRRLTETAEVDLDTTANNVPVDPIVPVGCQRYPVVYWICYVAPPNGLQFRATDLSTSKYVVFDELPELVNLWVEAGLPESWSQSTSTPMTASTWPVQPVLYMWIAERTPQ
jgi:hypothetical protein